MGGIGGDGDVRVGGGSAGARSPISKGDGDGSGDGDGDASGDGDGNASGNGDGDASGDGDGIANGFMRNCPTHGSTAPHSSASTATRNDAIL